MERVLYQGLSGIPCTRLLTLNGTMGCQSLQSFPWGFLHRLTQWETFVPPSYPTIYVLPLVLFNETVIDTLSNIPMVKGLIYIKGMKDYPEPTFLSNDLMFKNVSLPIFLMSLTRNDPSMNGLLQALEHDHDHFHYAVQMDAFMMAGSNSRVCLKQDRCTPIMGQSIWSTSSPTLSRTDSIILISTAIDNLSFFKSLPHRAATQLASLVAVLSLAHILKQVIFLNSLQLPISDKKHLLFTFFDLESFGLSGSKRFVQELTQPFTCHSQTVTFNCPKHSLDYCSDPCFSQTDFLKINLDNIEAMIHVSHVGSFGTKNHQTLVHTDSQLNGNVELSSKFIAQGMFMSTWNGYPPSSVSSFLAIKSIPAIVLADYDQHFNSPYVNQRLIVRYFHSDLDDDRQWNVDKANHVCHVVNQMAKGIATLLSVSEVPKPANCSMIHELFYCFSSNSSCHLLETLLGEKVEPTISIPHLIYRLMYLWNAHSSNKSCQTFKDCSLGDTCMSGHCYQSMTRLQKTWTFGLEPKQHSWNIVDESQPIFTESLWRDTRMRLFIAPLPHYERLVVGIVFQQLIMFSRIGHPLKRLSLRSFSTIKYQPNKPKTSSVWGYAGAVLVAGGAIYAYQSHWGTNVQYYQHVADAVAEMMDSDPLYDDGSYGPLFVRLAWHASGTYDKTTGTGGSNGATMRYAPESTDGANEGLHIARGLLEKIKNRFPDISYADLWTLAGIIAIKEMGGPVIPWRPGRLDVTDDSKVPPNGRLPDATKQSDHLRQIFYRMGFNDQEIVALSGAHALGRCHTDRSGFSGPWTRAPTTFSNQYFVELLNQEWVTKSWNGPPQYNDKKTGQLMMLISDLALIQDPSFRKYVELYAKDEAKFFKDFSMAFQKLLELGTPVTGSSIYFK